MFKRSRQNLSLWFVVSMGGILLLFAGIILYVRAGDKIEAIDRLLDRKARLIAASVQYDSQQQQVDLDNVPLLGTVPQPLDTEIVYVRWYTSDGDLEQFFGTPTSDRLTDAPGFLTLEPDALIGTPWLRQITLPIEQNSTVIGHLQVVIPLTGIHEDLRQFQLLLALTLLGTLGVIVCVSWWLSGLAMQPIRQSYEQLQQFTADASHELRSPLSAILTSAQAELLDAQHSPLLQNIVDSAKSMPTLVNHLLLLARHQGRLNSELLEPIDLNILLEAVADRVLPQAAACELKLILHLADQPIEVRAEPRLLSQANFRDECDLKVTRSIS